MVIASYGRGKTHFALALANYFGKSNDSKEVALLQDHIDHAADATIAQSLKEFRESRKPFLVIRLQGDDSNPLSQQFLRGLEQAIKENPETRGVPLPFWFEKAQGFLENLTSEQEDQAESILEAHSARTSGAALDLPLLKNRVAKRQADTYDLCRSLFKEQHGVLPDFGGEVNLRDATEWVVKEFCQGNAARAGGLLVLFDEFSLFVSRYATDTSARGSATLQDLLSGINNTHGSSLFVAFAQHDPDEVARNAFHNHDNPSLAGIMKELTRLPKPQRYRLHSSMETVLDSYLNGKDDELRTLLNQNAAFWDASDATRKMMARYGDPTQWSPAEFDRIVTLGCFPLHPLTTGLFSSVAVEQIGSNRSLLSFVLQATTDRLDQPVLKNGAPNWIYPIELVDWYGKTLNEEIFANYQDALNQLGGDATDHEIAMLKAALLFSVGELRTGNLGFAKIAAHLTGVSATECGQTLNALRDRGLIRFDDTRKVYTFYRVGSSRKSLNDWVSQAIESKPLEWELLEEMNTKKDSPLKSLSVPGIAWGAEEDWKATELLLSADEFTASRLKALAQRFRIENKELVKGPRGVVARLIARDSEEADRLRQTAQAVLDEAFGADDHPLPFVVAVPLDSSAPLITALLKQQSLPMAPSDLKQRIGSDTLSEAQREVTEEIEANLKTLRGKPALFVPRAFQDDFKRLGPNPELNLALMFSYRKAYPSHPPAFFTQYKVDQPTIRRGVKHVARHLATNQVAQHLSAIRQDSVAKDIYEKNLKIGSPGSWGLFSSADHLQEPPGSNTIHVAWEHLEAAFAPGKNQVPLGRVLVELLNPPFGFDYNQVTLLFCAWFGFHHMNLQLHRRSNGAMGAETLMQYLDQLERDNKPREFLQSICYTSTLYLSQSDPDAIEQEARVRLNEIAQTARMTLEAARDAIRDLKVYAQDQKLRPEFCQECRATAQQLTVECDAAAANDAKIKKILADLDRQSSLDGLLALQKSITEVDQASGRIQTDCEIGPAELTQRLDARLGAAVQVECDQYSALNALTEYGLHERNLKDLKTRLSKRGLTSLIPPVEQALDTLKEGRRRLEQGDRDTNLLAELGAMGADVPLARLRKDLMRLGKMKPQTEEGKKKQAEVRDALNKAVGEKTSWAASLKSGVEGITSASEAQTLRDQINRQYERFDGTQEQAALESALRGCKQRSLFFQELDEIQGRPLNTRAEVAKAQADLKDLEKRHHRVTYLPGDVLKSAKETIQSAVRDKEADAEHWLERQGKETDPAQRLHALERPPDFLPSSRHAELETMRRDARQQLDGKSANVILARFREIHDADRRKTLLQDLVRIAEAMERG